MSKHIKLHQTKLGGFEWPEHYGATLASLLQFWGLGYCSSMWAAYSLTNGGQQITIIRTSRLRTSSVFSRMVPA
jgi:hypothetical protein